jgi:hypothetical protein
MRVSGGVSRRCAYRRTPAELSAGTRRGGAHGPRLLASGGPEGGAQPRRAAEGAPPSLPWRPVCSGGAAACAGSHLAAAARGHAPPPRGGEPRGVRGRRGPWLGACRSLERGARPSRPATRPPAPQNRRAESGAPVVGRGGPGGHLRQDKRGFLLITQRYAAIGSPPC